MKHETQMTPRDFLRLTVMMRVPEPDVDPDRRLSCEQLLWARVVERAVMDARQTARIHDRTDDDDAVGREARNWFRFRSTSVGGWGWVIEMLAMPPAVVRHVEGAAFATSSRFTGSRLRPRARLHAGEI